MPGVNTAHMSEFTAMMAVALVVMMAVILSYTVSYANATDIFCILY